MAVDSVKQAKRTTNPGVRVVGGRIYDSSNGKTCHQCRQKTMDFVASCKVLKGDKPCPINYCHKCLLNRYGEKAEDVATLNDWNCPKCRGNCNCSFCRKKRGQNPTGILAHTAKVSGFSSVLELLQVKDSDSFSYQKKMKLDDVVTSPKKRGKENSFEGKCDRLSEEPTKPSNREGLKELNSGSRNKKKKNSVKDVKDALEVVVVNEGRDNDIAKDVEDNKAVGKIKKPKGTHKRKEDNQSEPALPQGTSLLTVSGIICVAKDVEDNKVVGKIKKPKAIHKLKEDDPFEVPLPQGTTSITVSGINIPSQDAGNVLQFLGFCSAFGKALDLREGQAKSVVRELLNGRSKRRQQYCPLIQMIIQLLTVILEDRGETSLSLSATNGSWFTSIGECLSKSRVLLDDFPSEMFEKGVSQYSNLDASKRLKLLNLLCDETLGTVVMRNYIDSENVESIVKKKEVAEKAAAAKEKAKQLKQKMQAEVAKALMEKNGAPLTITEHDSILSQIKSKAKEAHDEMLEAMDMTFKKRRRCDAVRIDPIISEKKGLIFWSLKSYDEEPNILLQDVGNSDDPSHEKWFAFKPEQKPEIEKYISCTRMKRLRKQKDDKAAVDFA